MVGRQRTEVDRADACAGGLERRLDRPGRWALESVGDTTRQTGLAAPRCAADDADRGAETATSELRERVNPGETPIGRSLLDRALRLERARLREAVEASGPDDHLGERINMLEVPDEGVRHELVARIGEEERLTRIKGVGGARVPPSLRRESHLMERELLAAGFDFFAIGGAFRRGCIAPALVEPRDHRLDRRDRRAAIRQRLRDSPQERAKLLFDRNRARVIGTSDRTALAVEPEKVERPIAALGRDNVVEQLIER